MPTFAWGRNVYFKDDETNNILKGKMFEPRVQNNELYIFIINVQTTDGNDTYTYNRAVNESELFLTLEDCIKNVNET
jgi:hypothetical protein